MYRVSPHLDRLALALLAGAALATVAVNLAPDLYYDAIEARLLPDSGFLPLVTPQILVTQGLMALFLFALGKEFFEALQLEGGALAHPRTRALFAPALAGGLVLPLTLWVVTGRMGLGDLPGQAGWSLCLGADLSLAWVFGRRLFGASHPALPLLMFLALALDMVAAGGIGLERFTLALTALMPAPDVADTANRLAGAGKLLWLLPAALAPLVYRRLFATHAAPQESERQHRRAAALGPILLTALVTWGGVLMAGLPAALALLALIPMIPHARHSLGLFAAAESLLHDPLNRIEAAILPGLPLVAFLFGLTAGGVDLSGLGPDTGRVLAALALRPLGLWLGLRLALTLGARLPEGVGRRDLPWIALLLMPGLTLPLLALDQGLGGGGLAAGARAGLALSLLAGPLALLLARLFNRT